MTKCFIVIRLIRFLLSSSRCYRGLEAAVGNQSGRAQTLSRWDQLTVIWFQNTLPEEALGRARPPRYEDGNPGSSVAAASSPPTCPSPHPPHLSRAFRWCWWSFLFWNNSVCRSSLNPSSLCQQGFLVKFIREIPESTGRAGVLSFLVSSIIPFTVNMSLRSGGVGGGWSMLVQAKWGCRVYWHSLDAHCSVASELFGLSKANWFGAATILFLLRLH